jgi:hypothetical protein
LSRITVPAVEFATGATAEVYAQVKKAAGSIPNLFVALWVLAPEALKAVRGFAKRTTAHIGSASYPGFVAP